MSATVQPSFGKLSRSLNRSSLSSADSHLLLEGSSDSQKLPVQQKQKDGEKEERLETDKKECERNQPVVKRGLAGGSAAGTLMGKEEAEAGDDCALERGRCPGKEMDRPAASMEAW